MNGWSPNQLRHTAAIEIRREFGIEAAQNTLGHSSPCRHAHLCGTFVGAGSRSDGETRLINDGIAEWGVATPRSVGLWILILLQTG